MFWDIPPEVKMILQPMPDIPRSHWRDAELTVRPWLDRWANRIGAESTIIILSGKHGQKFMR
jgi:hypothetical protein